MSDAIAMPGPWAAGSRPHRGHHNHHRSERRARREAFLAAMAADAGDDTSGRERGSRRGEGRGRGRFGGGPPFGPGGGRGRGRARRGDVRAGILALLAEEPRNGYGVIQEIEERSNGVWKPSPGAVYPALAQLEDEGLIRPVEVDGRKLFELTEAGRNLVDEQPEGAPAPWATVAEGAGSGMREAKQQLGQLGQAYGAVLHAGTPEQVEAAAKVLADARRSLYRILAEDDA